MIFLPLIFVLSLMFVSLFTAFVSASAAATARDRAEGLLYSAIPTRSLLAQSRRARTVSSCAFGITFGLALLAGIVLEIMA